LYPAVQLQAASLAYIDIFMVLCIGAAIMFVLTFFLEKNDPSGAKPAVE
jgi:hypothetical protein